MAFLAKPLDYVKLVSTYLFVWRKYLPECAKNYYSSLHAFAKFLSGVGTSSNLNLAEVDQYIEDVCSSLTETEKNELCEVFEQYFDFLTSRGYCQTNPFKPSFGPVQTLTPLTVNAGGVTQLVSNDIPCLAPVPSETIQAQLPIKEYPIEQTNIAVQSNHLPPPNIPLGTLIKKYANIRRLEGRILSESTIEAYTNDFHDLEDFLNTRKLDFNFKTLRMYIRVLNRRAREFKPRRTITLKRSKKSFLPRTFLRLNFEELSKTTIGRRKNAIRSLIKFGLDEELITFDRKWKNLLYTSNNERVPEESHNALNLEETYKIMTYLGTNKHLALRDKLELLVPLATGVRAIELVHVKAKTIDFACQCFCLTKTKGNKPRKVPIPRYVIPFLKEYIAQMSLKQEDYLFPTRQSKHMTTKTLNKHLKGMLKEAGIERTITAHDLRATFTTYLLYYGRENEKKVMEIMGHDDIATTFGYSANWHRDKETPYLEDIQETWTSLLYPDGFPSDMVFPCPPSHRNISRYSHAPKPCKVIPFIPSCEQTTYSSQIT